MDSQPISKAALGVKSVSGKEVFKLVGPVGKVSFKKLMECPVCLDICIPPVSVCCFGHHICEKCGDLVEQCGICSAKFYGTRNVFYEDCFNNSKFSCKYRKEGCKRILFGHGLKDHGQNCDFRPIKCFDCNEDVSFSNYLKHFANGSHNEIITSFNGEFRENYSQNFFTPPWIWQDSMVEFDGHTFFPAARQGRGTKNPRIGIFVWIFGNEETAKKYNVRISLESVGVKRPRALWEGPVVPIRILSEKVLSDGNCLMTCMAAIKSLYGEQSDIPEDDRDWTVAYKIIPVAGDNDGDSASSD